MGYAWHNPFLFLHHQYCLVSKYEFVCRNDLRSRYLFQYRLEFNINRDEGVASTKEYQAPMMLNVIRNTLQPYLDESRKLYVAFSGGLDSTVLLHLARQLSDDITAIHVNHNLSPNADAWQQHCQSLCEQWNVNFIAQSVHITEKGDGLEAEARKLRYAAIAEAIDKNAMVLTGQHQDDQLETFLLQLKRGAGPKGLSSMPTVAEFDKEALLIRPLLELSREQLEQYAKTHKLEWIEDESNEDTRFDRNFIRHQLTPELNDRWSGFTKAACRSISHIAEQQQLVQEFAEEDLKPLLRAPNQLRIIGLIALSKTRQRSVIRHWIDSLNITMPSQAILERMFKEVIGAKADANPKVQWAGHQLRRFRERIFIIADEHERPGIDFELTLNQPVKLNDDIGTICLTDNPDIEGLTIPAPAAGQKVYVRFGVQGLSIKPQDSKHTRKLKDLFKENGIPPWERSRTPLLFYGDELVAVGSLCAIEIEKGPSLLFLIYRH